MKFITTFTALIIIGVTYADKPVNTNKRLDRAKFVKTRYIEKSALFKDIILTAEQEKKIVKILEEFHNKELVLINEMQMKRSAHKGSMFTIGKYEAEMCEKSMTTRTAHYDKVKAILTPEQRAKFNPRFEALQQGLSKRNKARSAKINKAIAEEELLEKNRERRNKLFEGIKLTHGQKKSVSSAFFREKSIKKRHANRNKLQNKKENLGIDNNTIEGVSYDDLRKILTPAQLPQFNQNLKALIGSEAESKSKK